MRLGILIFLGLASKGFEKVSCSCMQCYNMLDQSTDIHSISGLETFMHPAHALSRRSSLFYVYIESATPTSWSSTSAHRKIELATGA